MSRPHIIEYVAWLAEWTALRRPLARKVAALVLARLWEARGLSLDEGREALRYLEPSFFSAVRQIIEDVVEELEAIASDFENANGREPNPAELAFGAELDAKAALDKEIIGDLDDVPF